MRILGDYALVYISKGRGYYADAAGHQAQLGPGDAIIVFPDLPHAYGPTGDQPWEQRYAVFNGPQFDLLQQRAVISRQRPVLHAEPTPLWTRRFEDVFSASSPHLPNERLRAVGSLAHLIIDLAAADSEAHRNPQEAWLSESVRLLSEPSAQGWPSPQQVAQQVGLSYENFRKLFAKRLGSSPSQFQRRRRIEHACAAIYQRSRSFKQLADDLGFCDVFHFSKAFTQVMGESPSAYRKRVSGM